MKLIKLLLLIMVLVMAFAPATAQDDSRLPQVTNVSIDASGTVSWNAVEGEVSG
jgi:hypothetical protein